MTITTTTPAVSPLPWWRADCCAQGCELGGGRFSHFLTMLTSPTPLQRQALDLLAVSHRHGYV